ncbi:Mobile element protein [Microcystis aeruginosa NIES-98]|nr:Mobile element protein [Microcystis aeruginosa NIES-98]
MVGLVAGHQETGDGRQEIISIYSSDTPHPITPSPHHPTPHTLHPTPYTLHPTPYTLHPTPHTPHPTPHTPINAVLTYDWLGT